MDPNPFPHLHLWCPRPFGTYTQNKPCPSPGAAPGASTGATGAATGATDTPPAQKPFGRHPPPEEPRPREAPSENVPPETLPKSPSEEGRVLLDTWYVIKPGNTKEKVAFFVAHQCGGVGGHPGGFGGRATTTKVKGNWGSDSSKAKRRRRCHDPTKTKPNAARANATGGTSGTDGTDGSNGISGTNGSAVGNGTDGTDGSAGTAAPPPVCPNSPAGDLVSVAQMVALVEQRTALALQSFPPPKPCGGPVVFWEAPGGEAGSGGADCHRVAEAVAHFEARRRDGSGPDGAARTGADPAAAPAPGEVRIAFRISGARDGPGGAEPGGSGRPNCVFVSRGPGGAGGKGGRAKDKITCDLYQLISPSGDALPNNVEFLLAGAKGEGGEGGDVEMGGEGTPGGKGEEGTAEGTSGPAGFHVDVVVTGVVDQCVFFGKDGAKKMKEETVKLPAQEDPPPGQLFLLPLPEEPPPPKTEPGEEEEPPPGAPDPSLCRLYRHVSHDFLEIRFKIQRLLEPRQYLLLLPEHLMVKIFSYLPTQTLAALKCSCHYFKSIIETFGIRAADSRWSRDPLYRDDPCKQCKKHYEKGDVSLCRWHPKPYHHDLPYGRSYWMCCRRGDKEAPGCRVGLHDNNWVHPAGRREEGR